MRCPECGSDSLKVIYMGLPMRYCCNNACGNLWGFWSWICSIHFNGWFFIYDGSYLQGLLDWLKGDHDGNGTAC